MLLFFFLPIFFDEIHVVLTQYTDNFCLSVVALTINSFDLFSKALCHRKWFWFSEKKCLNFYTLYLFWLFIRWACKFVNDLCPHLWFFVFFLLIYFWLYIFPEFEKKHTVYILCTAHAATISTNTNLTFIWKIYVNAEMLTQSRLSMNFMNLFCGRKKDEMK